YGDGVNDFVVAPSKEEALVLANEKLSVISTERGTSDEKYLTLDELRQEEDVLDTWFSSWLWPISVFDGIRNPENEEINYYYPTNDLVTGPDIIFFWVARMVFAGYEFRQEKPFANVYFTGIVRDKQGRKMSKSLGNSPDPIELMEKYGADGVRVGMLLCAAAGNDLLFEEELCAQGRNFSNKIWNSFRLVQGWEVSEKLEQPQSSKIAIEWYQSKFNQTLVELEKSFDQYRISEALMTIYKLVWDDFSSWFLEMVKPGYQQPIDAATYKSVIAFFENNLKVLHPYMPFISEEIWQYISDRKPEDALIIAEYPVLGEVNKSILEEFNFATEVISGIRTIRKDKNIAFKNEIEFFVLNNEKGTSNFDSVIQKMGNLSAINYVDSKVEGAISF
ncbi:MAG: class I tRNA ligase family protein, partial [Flavobacteriaceae bacterium]|nr:class I tRNA ligase family protein [Flavobacteriaceae bacterium]